jgi:hypothetical protein
MEPTQCGCMHRRARVHTDHGAKPVWLHVTQATKANVPRKTMSALPCTRQQWMRETDGHQTWTSGGTVELCFPVNRNASRTPKLYTSVIWDTYRAKAWKESNSLSCTLGARCALEQLVECAPGKKGEGERCAVCTESNWSKPSSLVTTQGTSPPHTLCRLAAQTSPEPCTRGCLGALCAHCPSPDRWPGAWLAAPTRNR